MYYEKIRTAAKTINPTTIKQDVRHPLGSFFGCDFRHSLLNACLARFRQYLPPGPPHIPLPIKIHLPFIFLAQRYKPKIRVDKKTENFSNSAKISIDFSPLQYYTLCRGENEGGVENCRPKQDARLLKIRRT